MRFQNGCKNNLSSNQLTVMIAHKILVEEAPEVSTIPEISEDNVESHKGYYRCAYVLLQLKTEDKIDNNEEQTELENYSYEEEKYDVCIDDERERHWRNFFEENGGGADEKALEKENFVKGKYLVEVVDHDKPPFPQSKH